MESIRDTVNFNKRLIELVKEQPILFDKQHIGYMNTAAKGRVWSAIAEQMGSTEEMCEERWRSLRRQYSRKQWMLFEEIHVQPVNSITNVTTPSPSSFVQDYTLDGSIFEEEEGGNSTEELLDESPNQKAISQTDLEEKMNMVLDTCIKYLQNTSTTECSNGPQSFGQIVTSIMNGLQPDNRARAMADILSYLVEVMRSELDEPTMRD